MTWQEGLPDAGAPVADSTQVVPTGTETQLLNGAYGGDYTQVADSGNGQGGVTYNDAFPAPGDTTVLPQGDPNAGIPQGDTTAVPGVNPDGTAVTTTDQTGGKVAVVDAQGRPLLMDSSGQVLAVGAIDQSTQQPVMVDQNGAVVAQVEINQQTGEATIIQDGHRIPIQMQAADATGSVQPGATGDQTTVPAGAPTDQAGGKVATLDASGNIVLTDQSGRTLAVATTDQAGQPVMVDESGNVVAKLGTDQSGQQAILDATTGEVIPFVQPGQQPVGTETGALVDTTAAQAGSEVDLTDVEQFVLGEDYGLADAGLAPPDSTDATVLPTDPAAQTGAQTGLPSTQTGMPDGTVLPDGTVVPSDTAFQQDPNQQGNVRATYGSDVATTTQGMAGEMVAPMEGVQPQVSAPILGDVISPAEQAQGMTVNPSAGVPGEQTAELPGAQTALPEDQRLGG